MINEISMDCSENIASQMEASVSDERSSKGTWEYASRIKAVIVDNDAMKKFEHIVRSFKSQQMPVSDAIIQLTILLRHKFDDIILGLNRYLSDGFEIIKSSSDGNLFYRTPMDTELVPLFADLRMQQVAVQLAEAKMLLKGRAFGGDYCCAELDNTSTSSDSGKEQINIPHGDENQQVFIEELQMELDKCRENCNIQKKKLEEKIQELDKEKNKNAVLTKTIRHLTTRNKSLNVELKTLQSQSQCKDRCNSNNANSALNATLQKNSTTSNETALGKKSSSMLHILGKLTQSINEVKLECQSCHRPMKKVYVSPNCLHRFCGKCYTKNLWEFKNECPVCKVFINSIRDFHQDKEFEKLVTVFHNISNIVRTMDTNIAHGKKENASATVAYVDEDEGVDLDKDVKVISSSDNHEDVKKTIIPTSTIKVSGAYDGNDENISWFSSSSSSSSSSSGHSSGSSSGSDVSGSLHKNGISSSPGAKPQGNAFNDSECAHSVQDVDEQVENNRMEIEDTNVSTSTVSISTCTLTTSSSLSAEAEIGYKTKIVAKDDRGRLKDDTGFKVDHIETHSGKKRHGQEKTAGKGSKRMKKNSRSLVSDLTIYTPERRFTCTDNYM